MKLSEVPDTPADATAKPRQKLSEVGGDQETAGSGIGAFFRSFLHGVGSAGVEAGKMGADLLTPAIAGRRGLVGSIAGTQQQRAQEHAQQPYVQAHPLAAKAGEITGEIAPSLIAPPGVGLVARMMGGAVPRIGSLAGRLTAGAAGGAVGAATQPTQGADFWDEKAKQLAIGATAGTILPGIGAAARSIRPEAQGLMRAGVQLTPGQQAGGVIQSAERTLARFPILGDWLRGREQRSIDGFNRAVVSQALEPIGVRVPRNMQAGHDLIDHGYQSLRNAYNTLLPHVTITEDQPFKGAVSSLRDLVSEGGDEALSRFDRTYKRVMRAFGEEPKPPRSSLKPTAPTDEIGQVFSLESHQPASYVKPIDRSMDGQTLKQVEMDLDAAIRRNHQGDGTARQLASSFEELRSVLKQTLARQNPQAASQLKNIDYGYAMMARIRDAATRRADSEGKFTPRDLLQAARSGEKKFSQWNFATGDALLQAFGEAGNRVIGKPLPGQANYLGPLHELSNVLLRVPAAATYGVAAGASQIGRGARTAAPYVSPAAGAVGAHVLPRKRIEASRKVSEIQRNLYGAKRRGNMAETQRLMGDLAEAQADYKKLVPGAA